MCFDEKVESKYRKILSSLKLHSVLLNPIKLHRILLNSTEFSKTTFLSNFLIWAITIIFKNHRAINYKPLGNCPTPPPPGYTTGLEVVLGEFSCVINTLFFCLIEIEFSPEMVFNEFDYAIN